MKYKVTTPNKNFNGTRLGVPFKDGEAVCEEDQAKRLLRDFGYNIRKLQKPKPPEKPPEDSDKSPENTNKSKKKK